MNDMSNTREEREESDSAAFVSGYECNFVSEPDDSLKCLICVAIARNPWQHGKCGRLFCHECLKRYRRHNPCPYCRMKQPQYMEDNRSKREITSLRVRCDNVGRNCEWEGTVGKLKEHMDTCEFMPIPCPRECKIKDTVQMIMRKDLENHLKEQCRNRDYECKHCKKKDIYAKIIDIHDNECERKIIHCSSAGCTETMERANLNVHLEKDCEHSMHPCKYETLGCDVTLKKGDMGTHEMDEKRHLELALDTVSSLQAKLAMYEEKECTLKKGEPLIFKLTYFQERKESNNIFCSQSFYTNTGGYKMYIEVHPNGGDEGTFISVCMIVQEGNYDDDLNWPFTGSIKIELLNQLADKNHYQKTIDFSEEDDVRAESNWVYPEFILQSELQHTLMPTRTQYLKDNTLYFRVSVKVSSHKPWLECTTTHQPSYTT